MRYFKIQKSNFFIIIFAIGLAALVAWKYKEEGKLHKQFTLKIESHQAELTAMEGYVSNTLKLQHKLLNKRLSLKTIDHKSVLLEDLIKTEADTFLIVAFKWDACKDCLDQEINFLKQNQRLSNKTIFLTSFNSHQAFSAYAKRLAIDWPIYNYQWEDQLLSGNDLLNGVTVFSTNNSFKIFHPHLASSGLPNLSEIYYKTLAEAL